MKKMIAFLGSVLLFTGLKAQNNKDSIVVKKETTAAIKLPARDSLKNTPGIAAKQNSPAGIIKKNNTVVMKEKVVLPVKGIIIPETDKPVKGNPVVKPVKG